MNTWRCNTWKRCCCCHNPSNKHTLRNTWILRYSIFNIEHSNIEGTLEQRRRHNQAKKITNILTNIKAGHCHHHQNKYLNCAPYTLKESLMQMEKSTRAWFRETKMFGDTVCWTGKQRPWQIWRIGSLAKDYFSTKIFLLKKTKDYSSTLKKYLYWRKFTEVALRGKLCLGTPQRD